MALTSYQGRAMKMLPDTSYRFTLSLVIGAVVLGIAATTGGVRASPARLHPALDIADGKIGVTQVWNSIRDRRGRSVRGQGVLVGVVDSGIDYRNPDFRKPDGTTRLRFIWDQTSRGKAPAGFTYGTECTSSSINQAICAERDLEGHGTHVVGIAAGNGRSSNPARYVGIANQSDLAVVKLRGTTETDIVDGCRYLFAKGKQLGEPVVINLSLGKEGEPHDGSGVLGQALNGMTGPGRIIVAAAGNESLRAGHASGVLRAGEVLDLRFTAEDATDGTLHLYYSARDTVAATIIDEQTGQEFEPSSDGSAAAFLSKDGTFKVATQLLRTSATWESFTVLIVAGRRPVNGSFDLRLEGKSISDSGKFNVWSGGPHLKFLNPDRYATLSTPGDVQNVISVASYTTRTGYQSVVGQSITYCDIVDCAGQPHPMGSLDLATSWGPTVDGRQKPDIAAPGGLIISSRTGDVPTCRNLQDTRCISPRQLVNDGRNLVTLGTSMASPMVAGTVALMLQLNSKLNAQQTRQILRQTARHDSFTGTAAWSAQWGAGKLNALAAVRAVQS